MRTSNAVQAGRTSVEVGETAFAMGIDEGSAVFLMDALGKLYSRPAQAALREYLSNGIDAHKAKGGDLPPVQVTLPENNRYGKSSGVMKIRDFGKGISEEEFNTIISRYGASTKRNSNKMIGGFGLGAKSGFALSDEFFMTSYQNGSAIKVRIFKDHTNQGYVDVMKRFSTSEPDGVLVEVPVPAANVEEVSLNTLQSPIHPFFLGYETGDVEIAVASGNYQQMESVHDENKFQALTLGENTVGWVGKNNVKKVSKILVTIGTVLYPLDTTALSNARGGFKEDSEEATEFFADLKTLKAFTRQKVINVPIGSVDLPSSREEISYTNRSIRTLSAIISNYVALLRQHIQKQLNELTTHREVSIFMRELEESRFKTKGNTMWKGQEIEPSKLFKKSAAQRKRSLHYSGLETSKVSALRTFSGLENWESVDSRCETPALILVDTVQDVSKAMTLLDDAVFRKLSAIYNLEGANDGTLAIFALPKDDIIRDWMFTEEWTEITFSELKVVHQKMKTEAELAAEKAAKQAQRKAEAQARAKQAQIERAADMLSCITLNKSDSIARQKAETILKRDASVEVYYLSLEEAEYYTLKNSQSQFMFPFKEGEMPNAFEPNYSIARNPVKRLKGFLGLFFPERTRFVLLGSSTPAEEFTAKYPEVKSAMVAIKAEVEKQIADANSKLTAIYVEVASLGPNYYLYAPKKTENKDNLRKFVLALTSEQKATLNEDLRSAVDKVNIDSEISRIRSLGGKDYLSPFLELFVTKQVLSGISQSSKEDDKALAAKYPLVMLGEFKTYTQAVIDALLEHIHNAK